MPRYRSYRGGHGKRPVLWILTLVVLLALGYGVYWVTEHISMNADGTIRVNLPQFISPAPSPTATATPSEPLQIVVVSPSPLPPSETAKPTPEPTSAPLRAVFVPQDMLTDVQRLTQLKADAVELGVNTLVLDYKSDEGVVAAPEALNAARSQLGDDFTYIARLSVFLDNTMTRQKNALAVKHTNGMNWLNTEGRWLNPYSVQALDYCVSVVGGAAALDFDAILLENVCFPWSGQLTKLTYGANQESSRYEAMEAFFDRLDALDTSMPLYVTALYDTVTQGQQDTAGQSRETLQERFDGVFAVWPDPLEALEKGITPILTDAPTEALDMKLDGITGGYVLYRPDGVYK